MDIHKKNTILITCSPGLVDLLAGEVQALGFKVLTSHKAGLEIEASVHDTMLLNLNLRTAFNVLFQLRQFNCRRPEELYKEISSIPWENFIDPDEYVSVVSRIDTPSIKNTMFASVKVKDAIVDRILNKKGKRPNSGSQKNNVVINLYWKKDKCWLYLNTSGTKLADRGYRKMPHKAPMQETLAAGVMMTTGYDGTAPLVCPMCGSGTLAIEAALIGMKKAPGLLRSNYGFMHIKGFQNDDWQQLRRETLKKADKKIQAKIIATDIDPDAVNAARKNATTAGVDHLIDFKVCDFAETDIPPGKGIVILNPEYGQRMGEEKKLEEIYKAIGDFFKKRCASYKGYIFTGNMNLAKKVGLKAAGRTPFFNGDIECRLLKYELYQGTKDRGNQ